MKHSVSTLAQTLQEFTLDPQNRTVAFRHHSQQLTRIEFCLLEHLVHQEGYLVPRQDLLQIAWGLQVTVESRTVDSHIVRLRRKLRAIGSQAFVIETVWGLGYRFRCLAQEEITLRKGKEKS